MTGWARSSSPRHAPAPCSCCGGKRVALILDGKVHSYACRGCDLLAAWPSVQRAAGASS